MTASESATPSSLLFLISFYSLILCALLAVAYTFLQRRRHSNNVDNKTKTKINEMQAVYTDDIVYLTHVLKADEKCTALDVIYAIITTPDMIKTTLVQDYDKVQAIRQERLLLEAKKRGPSQKKMVDFTDLLSQTEDDDWDNDNTSENNNNNNNTDESLLAKKAADAEKEKQAAMAQLKQATGQATQLLEGIDEGVLGQAWVESTLQSKNVWPPKLEGILSQKFDYNGQSVSALDHPAIRRNLCMVTGRLHSNFLNTHPALLEAGAKKLIDQTYFKSSMEFRGRMGVMFEVCIKTAVLLKSFHLLSRVIEAYVAYKVGCLPESVIFFNAIMHKQYGVLPRLDITGAAIMTEHSSTSGNVVVGCQLAFDLVRTHAEQFLKTKITLCQQQGIPPQIALQTFQEMWWVLMRWERLDGKPTIAEPLVSSSGADVNNKSDNRADLIALMDDEDVQKFAKADPNFQLRHAFPILVKNVAEKQAKIALPFMPPTEPGKYRFFVSIKSRDYMGADVEIVIDKDITEEIIEKSKEQTLKIAQSRQEQLQKQQDMNDQTVSNIVETMAENEGDEIVDNDNSSENKKDK